MKVLRTQVMVLLVALVAVEAGLRVLAWAEPVWYWEPPLWIRDATLGNRGNPQHPDHDARGYRNVRALREADVVAIGDSHTYGIGVAREEAWPAVLGAQLARPVYSIAHGGYGPGHYERVLPEALALRPRVVVIGVHLGNDLYDAYAFAKSHPAPAHLAELAGRAAARDREVPIQEEAARLFTLGRETSGSARVRAWLGDHLELYRFA